jgi:hypothetical protein
MILKTTHSPQTLYVCTLNMRIRVFISFIALSVVIFISLFGAPGCANIVPPAGGDRDSLPPTLIRSNPADSTRNFQGNKVSLTFDEYIQIDNFQQNVLLSPVPKSTPTATYKLNTLSVRFRDTLEPNTTYTINFGDAIKDVNEGNVMKNFTYVFSTGPAIDSLSLNGNVVLAESGKVDTTLIVMLHRSSDDSAVYKERPRYMARLNGKGAFTFRNLPPGTFYLYALKDEGRSMRYMSGKQLFAFADSPIVTQQNNSPRTLYAYQATSTSGTTTTTGTANAADKRLKFQTTVAGGRQDLLKKFSFTFERPLRDFDSTKVRLTIDSLYTPVTGYSWTLDSARKKLQLNYNFRENTDYHLIMEKDFATDTLKQQIPKRDTVDFRTLEAADYGKLSIRFRNLDFSKNPVLQFVQSDAVVASFPLTGNTFTQPLFLPGEFDLRILEDANKNGVWDRGEFFGRHRQPEIVKPVERKLNVKANWENEVEIIL